MRPFNFSFSIPKKLFIGFDSPVPPRISPLANLPANLATSAGLSEFEAYQTSVFWHHAMKARGAADFADGGDRLNGAAQIGRAILWLMAAPGAGFAEPPQQRIGIERAFVDRQRLGCEFFARNRRHLVGDRRRWQSFVDCEPGYRQ